MFLLTIEIESFSSFTFAFAFYHSSIFFFPLIPRATLQLTIPRPGISRETWNKENKSAWSFDLAFSFLESEYSVSINIFYRLILSNGIETKEHEFGKVLIFNERKAESILFEIDEETTKENWRDSRSILLRRFGFVPRITIFISIRQCTNPFWDFFIFIKR